MDEIQIILVALCGLVSWSHCSTSVSTLETILRPGDNVTLNCDCKVSTGVYIVWFRNCSHEYQPTLVLDTKETYNERLRKYLNFKFFKNESSNSYDLMIINITNSDEGLYYCGTVERKVGQDKNKNVFSEEIYIYGNITTRITLYTETHFLHPNISRTVGDCGVCWKLLFSVCPAVSVLSALFSSLLVYVLCQKPEKTQDEKKRCDSSIRQTEQTRDENVCYAALEIHQPSQRTKRKRTIQNSDFSTYSAIKTIQVEEIQI